MLGDWLLFLGLWEVEGGATKIKYIGAEEVSISHSELEMRHTDDDEQGGGRDLLSTLYCPHVPRVVISHLANAAPQPTLPLETLHPAGHHRRASRGRVG